MLSYVPMPPKPASHQSKDVDDAVQAMNEKLGSLQSQLLALQELQDSRHDSLQSLMQTLMDQLTHVSSHQQQPLLRYLLLPLHLKPYYHHCLNMVYFLHQDHHSCNLLPSRTKIHWIGFFKLTNFSSSIRFPLNKDSL